MSLSPPPPTLSLSGLCVTASISIVKHELLEVTRPLKAAERNPRPRRPQKAAERKPQAAEASESGGMRTKGRGDLRKRRNEDSMPRRPQKAAEREATEASESGGRRGHRGPRKWRNESPRPRRPQKAAEREATEASKSGGTRTQGRGGLRRDKFKSLLIFSPSFLQLYCVNGISPMGNSGCLPRRKPTATESLCPTYDACWVS